MFILHFFQDIICRYFKEWKDSKTVFPAVINEIPTNNDLTKTDAARIVISMNDFTKLAKDSQNYNWEVNKFEQNLLT